MTTGCRARAFFFFNVVGGPRLARVLEGPGQTSARLIPSLVAAALRYSNASEFVGVRSRSPVFVKRSLDIFLRWGEKKKSLFFSLHAIIRLIQCEKRTALKMRMINVSPAQACLAPPLTRRSEKDNRGRVCEGGSGSPAYRLFSRLLLNSLIMSERKRRRMSISSAPGAEFFNRVAITLRITVTASPQTNTQTRGGGGFRPQPEFLLRMK